MSELAPPLLIGCTFLLGLAARLAKLPPMVGFLAAGFVLRPLGLRSNELLTAGADLGVTLLMFTIGLKLDLRTLTRPVIWAGTSLHLAIVTGAGALLISALGALGVAHFTSVPLSRALLLGFALGFSSTVFALKVLEARSETTSGHGRIAIGLLIMQDVLAVGFLIVASGKVPSLWALLVLLLVPARPLFAKLLEHVGHSELLIVAGLFLALVVGVEGFSVVGLKADLGALCVGLALGSAPRAKELAQALWGVKELLLIAFFLQIGLAHPLTLGAVQAALLFLLLLPLKVVLYGLVFLRFGHTVRTSTLGALALANFSEFGLIVASVGVTSGLLEGFWLVALSIAVAVSFAVAAPLHVASERLALRLQPLAPRLETETRLPEDAPIGLENVAFLVVGLGRVGRGAYREMVESFPGVPVRGIDYDPGLVERLREQGVDAVAGDAHAMDFWLRVRPTQALRGVLLATSSFATNRFVTEHLRARGFTGTIVVVAQYDDQIAPLKQAGADSVRHVLSDAGAGLAEDLRDQLQTRASA